MATLVLTRDELEKFRSEPTWLNDISPRGAGTLQARITPAGEDGIQHCYFYFQYTNSDGVIDRIPLGTYQRPGATKGGISLPDARQKFQRLSRIYQEETKDVRRYLEVEEIKKENERRKVEADKKSQITIFEALERYQTEYGSETARKNVLILKRWIVDNVVGELLITEFVEDLIVDGMNRARAAGLTTMQFTIFEKSRSFLNWCKRKRFVLHNEAEYIDIKSFGPKPEPRDRFLDEETEVGLFLELLPESGIPRIYQLVFLVMLGAGTRIGETLLTRWSDLDFNKRVWTIPKKNAKTKKAIRIYLSTWLCEMFAEAREWGYSDEFVFTSNRGNPVEGGELAKYLLARQLTAEEKADAPKYLRTYCPKKYDASLKLPGGLFGSHDLRRTVATRVVRMTKNRELAHRLINHKIKTDIVDDLIDRTYIDETNWDDLKGAWEALSDWLYTKVGRGAPVRETAVPEVEEPTNVVRVQFGKKAG